MAASPRAAPRSRADAYERKTQDAMRPFRAKLAGRDAAPANVYCFGDSTVEGYLQPGTPSLDSSFPARLEDHLRRRFPTVGEGVGQGRTYHPILTAGAISTGWAVAGATPSIQLGKGINANLAKISTAAATMTKTFPVGVTDIDILYVAGTALTGITVAVDGGGPVSPANQTTGSTRSFVYSITGLAAGSAHTIVITTVGTNNWIDGAVAFYGNKGKGVHVFNAGHSGSRLSEYGQQSGTGNYAWYNPAAVSAATWDGLQSWTFNPPDLIVMNSGLNEYGGTQAETAANLQARITEFITATRTEWPSRPISFLLMSMYQPGIAQTSTDTWPAFVGAKAAAAAAETFAVHLDLTQLMPTADATNALGFYSNDVLHGSALGYQYIADAIASLVAP